MSARLHRWLNHGVFGAGIGSIVAGVCFIVFHRGGIPVASVAFGGGMVFIGTSLLINAWWIARARAFDTLETLDHLTEVYERMESEDAAAAAGESVFEPRTRDEANALLFLSKFLPGTLPAGWTKPIAPRGRADWVFQAGREEVVLAPRVLGERTMTVRVAIVPPKGTTVPVSEERCREILGCLPGVSEWAEIDGPRARSSTRFWFGAPDGLRPKFTDRELPDHLPTPRGRPPSRMAIELRHYLPEKLPPDWGVPVALANGMGWMFEALPFAVLVGFCTVRDRVKLIVTLIGPHGEEQTEAAAMSVLTKFRNVCEFVPDGDPEFPHMYLADLAPGGYAWPKSGGPEQAPN